MKILFAGIIARYPFGGVTWCSLMYLLGLRALGHEVFYIEDTGECVYDPVQNTRVDRPALRHQRTSTTRSSRSGSAIAGRSSTTTAAITAGAPTTCGGSAADADLFINLSGGSWFWRDEYARIPRKAFIDSDPAFTQLAIAKAEPWYVEFFKRFDHLFTFGANIGTPASPVPTGDVHVAQDLAAGDAGRLGTTARRRRRDRFTTVMTWQIESFTDVGGNKDQEFVKFIDLPSRTPQRFELAINGPQTAAARARLGARWTRWRSRARSATTATSSSARRRSSASPSTPTCRLARAGSAIAPSATWRRAGRRWCRTPAGPRTCRPARVCSRSRRPTKRSPASIASTSDYDRHARTRLARSPASTSTRRAVLPQAALDTAMRR